MRVLFLSHRLPYPPDRGYRVRAYHLLRTLATRHEVDLVSLCDANEQPDAHDRGDAGPTGNGRRLEDIAATVITLPVARVRNHLRAAASLAGTRPLTHALLSAPGAGAALDMLVARRRPDVVFVCGSGVAPLAMRPALAGVPRVVDLVDVDSEKWRALAEVAPWPLRAIYRREARCLARFEATLARSARATLVVNERERRALGALAPDVRADIVPVGLDVEALTPSTPPAADPVVIFTGVMDYAPNERGITWLARHVWPRVKAARPDARLLVVGAQPTAAIRALAEHDASITVTGAVPDVKPFLWQAALAVAPLDVARGVQVKVLEAVASRLPCVVTNAVAGGLPEAILPACVTADGAEAFAKAMVDLLALAPADRRALAERADAQALDWASIASLVLDAVDCGSEGKASTVSGRARLQPCQGVTA